MKNYTKEELREILKNLDFSFDTFEDHGTKSGYYKVNKTLYEEFRKKYDIFQSISEFIFFVKSRDNIDLFLDKMFCTCGKRKKFRKDIMYPRFCSLKCFHNDPNVKEEKRQTCLKKYNVEYPSQSPEIINKIKNGFIEKYGVDNPSKSPMIIDKIKNTFLERYGVVSPAQIDEIKQRQLESKRINHTFNTSQIEEQVYLDLKEKFSNVKRQYKSDVYPFHCDFYIPILDTYIEIQGMWTHGAEPFDPTNPEHVKIKNDWIIKSETSDFYKTAVFCWTYSDVLKRKTAEENQLQWKEFFNYNDFQNWLKSV